VHKFWVDRGSGPDPSKGVPTGGSEPVSWGYKERTVEACGGMTAGAAGALCIYDYLLDPNHSWVKDPTVTGGIAWLAANCKADRNPGNCYPTTPSRTRGSFRTLASPFCSSGGRLPPWTWPPKIDS